jgi:hypothetical protein
MYVGLEHFSLLPYNVTCNCNSKVNDFPSAADSSWQLLKILLGFTEPLCCHIHIFTSCFSEIHYPTFTHTYSKWFFSRGTKTKSKLMKAMVVAEQYCHVCICSNMLITANHTFRLNFKVLHVCALMCTRTCTQKICDDYCDTNTIKHTGNWLPNSTYFTDNQQVFNHWRTTLVNFRVHDQHQQPLKICFQEFLHHKISYSFLPNCPTYPSQLILLDLHLRYRV